MKTFKDYLAVQGILCLCGLIMAIFALLWPLAIAIWVLKPFALIWYFRRSP